MARAGDHPQPVIGGIGNEHRKGDHDLRVLAVVTLQTQGVHLPDQSGNVPAVLKADSWGSEGAPGVLEVPFHTGVGRHKLTEDGDEVEDAQDVGPRHREFVFLESLEDELGLGEGWGVGGAHF